MKNLIFVFLLLPGLMAYGQRVWEKERNNEGAVLLMNVMYGGHLPEGDLKDRFGGNFSAGLGLELLTQKNYLFGVQTHFHFGSEVKEDVLAPLRSEEGLIFDEGYLIADVKLRQRALYFGGHIGKIFRLNQEGGRSGLKATIGAGFLQHKIRVQDAPLTSVPQLSKEYKKGYDRLTNGLALSQFIGYHHLDPKRLVNFLAGFEFTQAFTQNRRSFNFDTRTKEDRSRLDLLFGFRIGWTLPFYVGESADDIQY
jgi:hypothetical protein